MITSADIARLSTTGRDALELVSMLPGFTLNAGTGLNNVGADYNTTSFGSGNLGSYGANGSAPQSGQVNVVSDGAQVTDPGDMGATTANINMDQVQEIKVQTSNFGADEAKGPIVINAVASRAERLTTAASTCTPATISSTPTTGYRRMPGLRLLRRNTTIPAPQSAAR